MKQLIFSLVFLLVVSQTVLTFSLEDDIQISLREKQIQELGPSGLKLVFYITIKNSSSKAYYLSGYTYRFVVHQQEYFQMQTSVDEKIKPGFTAVVSVITKEVADALLVPNEAIVSVNNQSAVMLASKDGTSSMVPVEIGASSDTFSQILKGEIVEGDRIAVANASSDDGFPGFPGMPPGMGQMRQITGGSGPGNRGN